MNKNSALIQRLQQEYGVNPNVLARDVKRYLSSFHEKKFLKAFEFAARAHEGQERKSGAPYITHPFETVRILVSLHVDEDMLIAALLHDVPEDTDYTIEDIESRFGKKVAFLVDGITKLSKVHYQHDMLKRQVDSLKKLFLHTAEDPRIIIIKLADRLHNMRTLHFIDKEEKRSRIARETLEIFVPIANLLGIEELKSELEDLCFRYLYPSDYSMIAERMQISRKRHKPIVDRTIAELEKLFKEHGIHATIYGRLRKLYSIYKRMLDDAMSLQEYDNSVALRIIVRDREECYQVLGLIHSLFKPKPGKFKDYVAVPKRNGYQSLHTTVFGFDALAVSFQIRTHQMHLEAEYGIASSYFEESSKAKKNLLSEDSRAGWAEKIMQIQEALDKESESSDEKFMLEIKNDVLRDRISTFTPKGQQIDLPAGATCIDFAYVIHSEVGNRALKAEVNGHIVPMATKLQAGDTVNIITSDMPRTPNQAWLDFVKTNNAKSKILEAFKKISRQEKLKTGAVLLQKELDRAGLGLLKDISPKQKKMFANRYKRYRTFDDILVGIAEGLLRPRDFVNALYPQKDVPKNKFVAKHLFPHKNKFTPVHVKVVSRDAVGQLKRILNVLADLNLSSLRTVGYLSLFQKEFICRLTVAVHNYSQVSRLFENLEQIDGVKRVERLYWQKKAVFFLGCLLTFIVWAAHPYILFYIKTNLTEGLDPVFSHLMLYSGILLLFMVVYLLKSITQRSFPELRETNILWSVTFLLTAFAFVTLFAEVYFFEITFNWFVVISLSLLFSLYLVVEYIRFQKQHS